MKIKSIIAALAILMASSLLAQRHESLSIGRAVPIAAQYPLSVLGSVKCGSEGQVLARFTVAGDTATVTAISADGKHLSAVGPDRVPRLKDAELLDFSPGSAGEIYLLFAKFDKESDLVATRYLAVFDREGTFVSLNKLQFAAKLDFTTLQLAAFPNGNLLVAGYDNKTFRSRASIISADGEFIKDVRLDGDIKLVEKKEDDDKSNSTQGSQKDVSQLESSNAEIAGNGSILLFRHTPEGPVFVVSPGGSVKRIVLKPPQPDLRLLSVKANELSLLAQYLPSQKSIKSGHHTQMLLFTKLANGSVEGNAEIEPDYHVTGIGAVCYREESIVFLSMGADGNLQFVSGERH